MSLQLPAELVLRCSACGALSADPLQFSCPAAEPGDDIDHLLVAPEPDVELWPAPQHDTDPDDVELEDPFVRYRSLFYPYRLHRRWGGDDAGYRAILRSLQSEVGRIDGRPFRRTPLLAVGAQRLLGAGSGIERVWVKNETGNVSGSHKGRHLFGLALHLAIVELHGGLGPTRPRLAISSCGNAALAAAVVAKAARYELDVFVPPDAAAPVMARLEALGATIHACRRHGGVRGDPCYLRFVEQVADGALPFATVGPSNGLTVEGGATLGYELADQLAERVRSTRQHLYIQVGGGALAAAVMTGLSRAQRLRRIDEVPALHAVQASAVAPLVRAHRRLRSILGDGPGPAQDAGRTLDRLAAQRSELMWPWEREPQSLASGILDDETYDWRAVLVAIEQSGGDTLTVSEAELATANDVGCTETGIDADATGTAGLAGLRHEVAAGGADQGADAIVIFSGARRH